MMATFAPFQASAGTTVGNTVKVTANTSATGTLNCTNILATSILVTNAGTALVFVRLSPEASPTATAKDIPIPGGQSKVLSNPVPFGTLGIGVLSSTGSSDVYFTPGTGSC